MREIEVKAKIKNKEELLQKLCDLGCVFSENKNQYDKVYFPNDVTFEGKNIKGHNILRIRTEHKDNSNKHIFTFKKATGDYLNKIEKESEIMDAEVMHDIITNLGYYLFVKVKKDRITTNYKSYEICIDEVEELGSFIEIEKIVEEEVDGNAIIEDLNNILIFLGVDPRDNVTHGYDILLGRKNMQILD